MKRILFVDDEKNFLLSLTQWLQSKNPEYHIAMAENGREALEFLRAYETDLVVTDLQMPVMDGFQLLSRMNQEFPHVPVIIMTAFGTAEIKERLEQLGWGRFLDKPIDIDILEQNIMDVFDQHTRGALQGITPATFAQIISMEGKSCTLQLSSEKGNGKLFFLKGELIDAQTGSVKGEEAAYLLLAWTEVDIQVKNPVWRRKKRIREPLQQILLKSCELQDNQNWTEEESPANEPKNHSEDETKEQRKNAYENFQLTEESLMDVQKQLAEFKAIDGFMGAGIFTPGGEALAMLAEDQKISLQEVGVLANNVLMNAQKASLEMGTGRGQMVHIEAESAHILVRCLNEGKDPLASEPGKAHIHLVLIMNSENLGMAKLRIGKIIQNLAEEFRP